MTAREMFIKLGYKYSFDTFKLGGTSNFISSLDYAYGCHINCVDMDFSAGQRSGEFGIIFLWIARFGMD